MQRSKIRLAPRKRRAVFRIIKLMPCPQIFAATRNLSALSCNLCCQETQTLTAAFCIHFTPHRQVSSDQHLFIFPAQDNLTLRTASNCAGAALVNGPYSLWHAVGCRVGGRFSGCIGGVDTCFSPQLIMLHKLHRVTASLRRLTANQRLEGLGWNQAALETDATQKRAQSNFRVQQDSGSRGRAGHRAHGLVMQWAPIN
jgi:hypothetical protein